jgi:tRNA (uracil-5-)-methyltransferase
MVNPFCEYFGVCGGCSSQDVGYESQLKRKWRRVRKAIGFDEVGVFHADPCAYRCRMDFAFHPGGVGLRRKGSWSDIVDIRGCPLSNDRLNGLLGQVRDYFRGVSAFDIQSHVGLFRYALIRSPGVSDGVSIALNGDSPDLESGVDLVSGFSRVSDADNVVCAIVPANVDTSVSDNIRVFRGDGLLCEKYLGMRFLFSSQGFFQNNSQVMEMLHDYVRANLGGGRTLVDLYGGVGVFGIINSGLFDDVVIVESDGCCVDAAERNIGLNRCDNVCVRMADAKGVGDMGLNPHTTIVDPPRGGMHPRTLRWLLKNGGGRIVYVSCNLKHLAADISMLKKHYSIEKAAFFDMFPQTPHVESVVILGRD